RNPRCCAAALTGGDRWHPFCSQSPRRPRRRTLQEPPQMLNVVTYCRVSSDEQAFKDLSIPAQRKQLSRWLVERPDHRVVGEFVDEGESAYAPASKRPGFCAMVAHCRRNKVNAILVHKLDRFSRNQEESVLFKSLLRQHGVKVKSISENFDADTPSGFLYEG